MLILAVIILFALYDDTLGHIGNCDRNTGPSGAFGCISIARYQGDQYANCLTDDYIKQKSKGKHHCQDPTSTYCWYQCMLENHFKNDGPVSDDCRCDSKDTSATTPLPLDAKCHSPDGSDCTWYRDCLEKRHNCANHPASYAIQYAEKFCTLYQDNYKYFTEPGKQWVDGVRKCLQTDLVPIIRPYFTGDCAKIKELAFASHAPCYLNPGFGAPSICDLSCSDWFAAFWTIKDSFRTSDKFESFWGVIRVSWGCKSKVLECSSLGYIAIATPYGRMISLVLLLTSSLRNREKRDISQQVDGQRLSADVIDQVAQQLNWNHNDLDWFAFTEDEQIVRGNNVSINIWLIQKDKTKPDMMPDHAVKFENWISSGKNYLSLEVNGTKFSPVSLSVCNTANCVSINSTTEAGPPTAAAEHIRGHGFPVMFIGLVLVILFNVF